MDGEASLKHHQRLGCGTQCHERRTRSPKRSRMAPTVTDLFTRAGRCPGRQHVAAQGVALNQQGIALDSPFGLVLRNFTSSSTIATIPAYAELRCVSNFTFLRGASQPDEPVARAKQLGYTALAIADECSLAGIVRAHVAAKEHGLKLLVGAQFAIDWGAAASPAITPFVLTALGCNLQGYGNLCQFITKLRRACMRFGRASSGGAVTPQNLKGPRKRDAQTAGLMFPAALQLLHFFSNRHLPAPCGSRCGTLPGPCRARISRFRFSRRTPQRRSAPRETRPSAAGTSRRASTPRRSRLGFRRALGLSHQSPP